MTEDEEQAYRWLYSRACETGDDSPGGWRAYGKLTLYAYERWCTKILLAFVSVRKDTMRGWWQP